MNDRINYMNAGISKAATNTITAIPTDPALPSSQKYKKAQMKPGDTENILNP